MSQLVKVRLPNCVDLAVKRRRLRFCVLLLLKDTMVVKKLWLTAEGIDATRTLVVMYTVRTTLGCVERTHRASVRELLWFAQIMLHKNEDQRVLRLCAH